MDDMSFLVLVVCGIVMWYSMYVCRQHVRDLKRTSKRAAIYKALNKKHNSLRDFNRLLEKIGVMDQLTAYSIEVNSLSKSAQAVRDIFNPLD